jgi:hypothetical protein
MTMKFTFGNERESEMTISAEYKAKTSTGASIHIIHNNLPAQVNEVIIWMLEHPDFAMDVVEGEKNV